MSGLDDILTDCQHKNHVIHRDETRRVIGGYREPGVPVFGTTSYSCKAFSPSAQDPGELAHCHAVTLPSSIFRTPGDCQNIPVLIYSDMVNDDSSKSKEKPLHWVASAKRDYQSFPDQVQDDMGYALGLAQLGARHPNAKPWKGEGPGVFEIVEDHRGDAYRAVYTVHFAEVVYVLHAFQKKSKTGIKTSQTDVELIAQRLKRARSDYESRGK